VPCHPSRGPQSQFTSIWTPTGLLILNGSYPLDITFPVGLNHGTPRTAEASPPPKSKSKSGAGLDKAETKRSGIGDNGEGDSDEENKRRRFRGGHIGDSSSNLKVSR
jgi:hypothetical protein